MEAFSRKGVRMRARVLMGVRCVIGVIAVMPGWWASVAQAQLSNSPWYQPSPTVTPPYLPAPRYPMDSRNPTLDNRSPSLKSVTPDFRDPTPRLGSSLEDGASGRGMRRSEGLRAPGVAEPGRPSWR